MSSFSLLPYGVSAIETDLSQRIEAASTSTGAAVFQSKKGPLGRTLVTNRDTFLELYGKPDPSVSFGHDTCLDFLMESNSLWCVRVHNGAKYAGTTYHIDREVDPTITYKRDFVEGEATDFNYGGRQLQLITFSADLVTGNSVGSIGLDDGGTQSTTSAVVFSTDAATTMTNLAAELSAKIAAMGIIGTVVEVIDTKNLRVISPPNTQLILTAGTVTGGASQPTMTVVEDIKLFDVYAENPGAWANDVGIKITNIDRGTPQRINLTFAGPLVTGNKVNLKINGFAISEVTFDTNSDTTMAALATAIVNCMDTNIGTGGSATVKEVGNGTANDREIVIVSPTAKVDLTLSDLAVTGGSTQTVVNWVETLKSIAPDGTFTLQVFTRDNINRAVEEFRLSLAKQQDGFNNQQNIAQVINESGKRSKYIRVYQPDVAIGLEITTEDTAINWLSGGDDGYAVASSHIKAGWNQFANRQLVSVRLLLNCGYTSVDVHQHMVSIARKRRDALALLDMPSQYQDYQSAVDYRVNILNVDDSYAAICTPDVKIVDEFTDIVRFIPPSGKWASTFAYTDRVRSAWFSNAGLNRGKIRNVIGLRHEYDEGQQKYLQDNQIVPIIRKPGVGYVVWGDDTLQRKASALSNINVRRLLILIEVALTDALDYSVFEPNDSFTRFQIVQMIEGFLQPIRDNRGLYEFLVVCDDSNNKSELVDAGQLNIDVFMKPTLPAKRIRLQNVITRTGATFTELLQLGGNF